MMVLNMISSILTSVFLTLLVTAGSWFYLTAPLIVFPILFVIDAPFGRFSPKNSRLSIDGTLNPISYYHENALIFVSGVTAWVIMEIFSPASFIATYLFAPFSPTGKPPPLNHPSTLLAALFVVHYINRAIISPLRSPGRSRTHLVVVFAAIIFNLVNPPLLAAFLSAPETYPNPFHQGIIQHSSGTWNRTQDVVKAQFIRLSGDHASQAHETSWTHPTFLIGITLFLVGFASNIFHDEILYQLRRDTPPKLDGKHTYAIPYGYLYERISYPNYFSEWIEFIGFALAASPRWEYTPPWMFVVAELMVMLPRAYKGHQWYLQKFPDYPRNRKVVIPFVF
jgi:3-oxo-5-alpha-steroid 4-dehydrogenase 1